MNVDNVTSSPETVSEENSPNSNHLLLVNAIVLIAALAIALTCYFYPRDLIWSQRMIILTSASSVAGISILIFTIFGIYRATRISPETLDTIFFERSPGTNSPFKTAIQNSVSGSIFERILVLRQEDGRSTVWMKGDVDDSLIGSSFTNDKGERVTASPNHSSPQLFIVLPDREGMSDLVKQSNMSDRLWCQAGNKYYIVSREEEAIYQKTGRIPNALSHLIETGNYE